MKIITTINDLEAEVDSWTGSGYWTLRQSNNDRTVCRIASQLSDEAHAAGLKFGGDWESFLDKIEMDRCFKWLQRRVRRISRPSDIARKSKEVI